VDPEVAETGQPYAFTGDDPLNETDPLGLMVTCGGGCSGDPGNYQSTVSFFFSNPYAAEKYVRHMTGGKFESFRTASSQRNVDVAAGKNMVEVKTGRQSLTSFARAQVAKDVDLANAGKSPIWVFYPNGKGITKPSQPLLNYLASNNIPVYQYNYQAPEGVLGGFEHFFERMAQGYSEGCAESSEGCFDVGGGDG
jgi:hypothetical protein